MAKKRRNGEGSWGKKTMHGVVYCYYRDTQGHYTYAKTEKEVRAKIKANEEQAHIVKADSKLTVGGYMKSWLYDKKYKEVGVSLDSSTFDCYETALAKRLYDYPIATLQLSALDKNALMKYLKALAEKYSRGSIKKTWQVLTMGLSDEDFELNKFVPEIKFEKIKIPSESNVAVKKKIIQFTSNEDMDTLYSEALRKTNAGTYYYGNAARLLAFIMYSGLRVAEASGLQWKDVDMRKGLITVAQTYSQIRSRDENGNMIGYEYIVKSPKTESSFATIPYRQRGGEILQLMDSMNPKHTPTDFVFLTDTGTPFMKRHVLHTLKRMLNHTHLTEKGYTVHDLRHGYGSILYQENVDIYTISKLLRHKDIQTTANIYVATTPDILKNVLDKVDSKSDQSF